jgi:group I intron endonuclease
MGVVYKITSPSGKCYIGKTVNFISRMNDHRRLEWADGHCTVLQKAIRKYKWENMKIEVLFETNNIDELNQAEKDQIKAHKSNYNGFGYNCTDGGDGGYTWSDGSKEKAREAMLKHHRSGPGHTKTAKSRISTSLKKYKQEKGVSVQHRSNLSKSLKGRVFTAEWKENIGAAARGRKMSKESSEKKSIKMKAHYAALRKKKELNE